MSTSLSSSTDDAPEWRGVVLAAWIFLITGLAFSAAAIGGVAAPLEVFFDLVFWPGGAEGGASDPKPMLLAGIAGALLAGWATTLLILARNAPWSLDAALLRRAFGAGLLVWFALDGAASIAVGAAMNLLGNLFFLIVLGWPLLRLGAKGAARGRGGA